MRFSINSKKGAAAVIGTLALAGAGLGFAIGTGGAGAATVGAITSNGEAGYYTQATGNDFYQTSAAVIPFTAAEQMGANGGVGLQLGHEDTTVSNGNTCDVAQLGIKWVQSDNGGTGGYRVYLAVGTLAYDPNNATDGNTFLGGTSVDACTAGGALNTTPGTTHLDGYFQNTQQVVQILGQNTTGNPTSPVNVDLLPGQAVSLNLQHFGWDDVKGWAEIQNPTPKGTGYVYQKTTAENFAHLDPAYHGNYEFANAGTVFDSTVRTPATVGATTEEARFDGLRAGYLTGSGFHKVLHQAVYSAFNQQEVISTANGTAVDPAVVLPSNLTYSVFNLYIGVPTGA